MTLLLTACSNDSPVASPTVAPLAFDPELQVVLPETFVVGRPQTVAVGLRIDECHTAGEPTIDEVGVRARVITAWQAQRSGAEVCRAGSVVFVDASVAFHSAGTGTLVVRGQGEDGVTRDHLFDVEVLP